MPASPPIVLTIAGSDSSCGAGLQADLKTIAALGGYGVCAVTSVVSEAPGKVSQVRLLEPAFIADQLRVLFAHFPIAAAKTGMLGGAAQVEAVVAAWKTATQGKPLPLVVDPVMVATGGGKLLEDEAVSAIESTLFPLACVITPNLDEARVLHGEKVETREQMEACAAVLAARHGAAFLVKGGHLRDTGADDVLYDKGNITWLEAPRTSGVHTHGTGCAYSAAIATGLASGLRLVEAVRQAKEFISSAIAEHFAWEGNSGKVHALNHLNRPS